MGCGESKHDVASGNTITRKKSDAGEQSKKSKDIENASLLAQQQGKEGDQNVKHNNNEANGDLVPVAADHHIKDIAENTEAKEGDSYGNNKEKERLIAKESPNRFFSSRKEEESIDGIEGRSEKSEYDSPRPEVGKESLFNDKEKVDDVNAVMEEKKLVQETIPEAKNAEGASEKKEENLTKETENEKEKAPAVKAEVSVSAAAANADKNLDNAEKAQEQSAASPSGHLKTV